MTRRVRFYLGAAPWPHATALGLISGCPLLTLAGWEMWAAGLPLVGAAGLLLAGSCLWGALLSLADGRARYHEYCRLTRIFLTYGLRRRVLNAVSVSRCQRDAATAAARRAGFGRQASNYFLSLGYRWYHLAPDRVVTDPRYVLSLHFWRTGFLPPRRRQRRGGLAA